MLAYHERCLGQKADLLPDPWHCPKCQGASKQIDDEKDHTVEAMKTKTGDDVGVMEDADPSSSDVAVVVGTNNDVKSETTENEPSTEPPRDDKVEEEVDIDDDLINGEGGRENTPEEMETLRNDDTLMNEADQTTVELDSPPEDSKEESQDVHVLEEDTEMIEADSPSELALNNNNQKIASAVADGASSIESLVMNAEGSEENATIGDPLTEAKLHHEPSPAVFTVENAKEEPHDDSREGSTSMIETADNFAVQMPPIENIELAARLSAFDNFLFLADGYTPGKGLASTGDEDVESQVDIGSEVAASNEPEAVQSTRDGVYKTNEDELSKVTLQLIQRKQRSHHWPTVKILPGMDVIAEENEQSMRKIPFEEQIVFGLVPGSMEESKELSDRLSAFDSYMFLLDDGNDVFPSSRSDDDKSVQPPRTAPEIARRGCKRKKPWTVEDDNKNELEVQGTCHERQRISTIAPTKKNLLKKSFSERIDELKAFKAKHGHMHVHKSDNPSLYAWMANVKSAYNNPGRTQFLITEDRIASLDAIGFDWERKRAPANESTVQEAKNSKEEEVDEELTEFSSVEATVNQDELESGTNSSAESSKEGDDVKEQNETKNTTTTENSKEEKSVKEERTLIGATIRIKKGQSKGLIGTITEKRTIRRLKLDTITAPMDFDNVQIVEYTEDANRQDEYQKYAGAKVRVIAPHPEEGKLGTVVKVIAGDWYITDNPEIHTAFPSHKFDILKYANGDEPGDIDNDSDIPQDAASKEEATKRIDAVIASCNF